jgi:hypothetical protein
MNIGYNMEMSSLHITSVKTPFEQPDLYPRATRFLRRADAMGLLDEPIEELSATMLRRVARSLSNRGLARDLAALLSGSSPSHAELARYLDAATAALEESPVPAAELSKLTAVLGSNRVCELLEISPASLQRYQRGEREAPDDVADRAHFLTSVIAALEGTYNEFGIRRWLERPRSVFDGRTARQLLGRHWTTGSDATRRILDAAESLEHLGAT